MARSRPPSFDFFPEDFLAGTMHLHPVCIGIYIRLLCFQWSHGAIPKPSERRQLMQVTGALAEELDQYLPQVLDKFEEGEDGALRNARLERERERKTQFHERQRANGRLGGRPPKDAKKEAEKEPKHNPRVSSGLSEMKPKQKPPIRKLEVGSQEVPKKEKRNAPEPIGEWIIPERLDTPEIRELLAEFEEMRIKNRVPIKDLKATSKVLKHFDDTGHLAYALEYCIANGYQGLKPDYRKPLSGRPVQKTFAELRVEGSQRAIEEFSNG